MRLCPASEFVLPALSVLGILLSAPPLWSSLLLSELQVLLKVGWGGARDLGIICTQTTVFSHPVCPLD